MSFCSSCLIEPIDLDLKTIHLIREEYLQDSDPWFIGYSGGKDSSALLSLVIRALHGLKSNPRKVSVVFCDTGVENPVLTEYVYETFKSLKNECADLDIPINFIVAKPELKDRFFVKVIGRGYPTPTNIFRWCTKVLRINPVSKIIGSNTKSIVLLGVRLGESAERDRTIHRHQIKEHYYLKQNGSSNRMIFAPIIDYSIKDVWASIKFKTFPTSISHEVIGKLYKDAGAECPVFKESKGAPCGKGRFGCWTCTVVRKDRSVEKMIENGWESLQPLFEFRNWLAEFRDNRLYRCTHRRNGKIGLGPFTLEGRKIILDRLLKLETDNGIKIIDDEELQLIYQLWQRDLTDYSYNNENYARQ